MRIKKAIILAAGYGTRSLPITKVIPKEMFPIKGKPAIHYVVEEAVASGIEEILIVVSRNKNSIIDYFDRSLELETFLKENNKSHLLNKVRLPNVHFEFVRQPYARGLADAIKLGKPFINNEPFAVLLPDDLFVGDSASLSHLINMYQKVHTNVIGLKEAERGLLQNYGVIAGKQMEQNLYSISNLVEKPKSNPPSNLAVVGRYVLHPSIFNHLTKVKTGKGGEVQLTDALVDMLKDKKCYGYQLLEERFDIGSEDDYFNLMKRLHQS